MNRYDELEKLYYKKLILKFLIVIGVIVSVLGIFFILKINKEKHINKSSKPISNSLINKKNNIKKIKKEKNASIIVKKTDKKIKKITHKKITTISFVLPDISKISSSINKEKAKKEVKTKLKEVQLNHIANLDVKIIEKTPDLKELIKKFNQTNDFDLAIVIAKKFLNKNDLKNAQIWALRANNINPSSYKSWILFANILLKEKKIKKAKKILKVYIDSYGQNDIIEEKLRSLNDK